MTDFFVNWRMKYSPYPHQEKEFLAYRDAKARALLWQPRTGKTKECIDIACYLFETGKIDAVFVLAPNLVHYNWNERELPAHCWDGIEFKKFLWVSKNSKNLEGYNEALKSNTPIWFSMNSEALRLERALKAIKMLIAKKRTLLIVDESHNYRTPGSKRTKRLRGLKKYFPYRRILTGTSIENSPLAAFSQFEILEDEALDCRTYHEFKELYAEFSPRNYGRGIRLEIVGYKNLDLLAEKISKWSSIVGREGMPPFVSCIRDFEMTKEQLKQYQEFENNLMISIKNEEISTTSLAVKVLKLQQIASGFIINEDGSALNIVEDDKNPRLLALFEELETLNGKNIIWCKFKEDIAKIRRQLIKREIKFVEYHGSVNSKARNQAIDAFNNDPECLIFLGQPDAGGTGLTLSIAENVIWYSHTYDAIIRAQASERATRLGGHSVTLIDICAFNSIDQKILNALKNKVNIVNSIMELILN